jgi:hypothetical protein
MSDINETDDNFFRTDAAEYAEKVAKRGVIYISRIPPFMKPNKVRSIFEIYGEVTRLFLGERNRYLSIQHGSFYS